LKELAVCFCDEVTDAGISMVVSHCNQLCVLNLKGLIYITGMCALCEDLEPTLCFINSMGYDILTAGLSPSIKALYWTIILAGIIQIIPS